MTGRKFSLLDIPDGLAFTIAGLVVGLHGPVLGWGLMLVASSGFLGLYFVCRYVGRRLGHCLDTWIEHRAEDHDPRTALEEEIEALRPLIDLVERERGVCSPEYLELADRWAAAAMGIHAVDRSRAAGEIELAAIEARILSVECENRRLHVQAEGPEGPESPTPTAINRDQAS